MGNMFDNLGKGLNDFHKIIKTKKLLTSFCLSARMWKY